LNSSEVYWGKEPIPQSFFCKKRTCGEDREDGRSVDNGGDQLEKNKAVKAEKEKEGKVETLYSKCYL
jgi:hypothetical protein